MINASPWGIVGNISFVNILTIAYILVHGFLRLCVYYSMKQIFEEEGKPFTSSFKICPRSLHVVERKELGTITLLFIPARQAT
jgi:hypothetical protein